MLDEVYHVGVGGFGIIFLWMENCIAMEEFDFSQALKDVPEGLRSSWVVCLDDLHYFWLKRELIY